MVEARFTVMELEVLVEIQESKRAIKLSSDLVNRVEEIRDALKLIDPVIHVEPAWRWSGRNTSTKYSSFYLTEILPRMGQLFRHC